VLATSLDGCVRTFDIPTGRLVDVFRTESVATSLSFSPTGDFLATAHVNSLAVHLWYVAVHLSERQDGICAFIASVERRREQGS
jgi:WD40 repeat protein